MIRTARDADVSAVSRIANAAYSKYIERIGREPGPMLEDYAARIAEGDIRVVERDGAVAGFIFAYPKGDHVLLDTVAVAPEFQGFGLGRELIEAVESAAAAAGYREVQLYTNEAMTENLALYARNGYRETRRVQEDGFRRVYMAKTL